MSVNDAKVNRQTMVSGRAVASCQNSTQVQHIYSEDISDRVHICCP
jgi:hypothetical protein